MNDLVRFATSVEYTTGKKRGRHPVFNSNMFYPYKEERRLQQATRNELESFVGAAFGAAVAGESFVSDSLDDLSNLPEELSEDMKREISYAAGSIARKASQNIVNMTEMVVGKPYFPPSAKQEILDNWQSNFAMLCKSAKSDVKKDISMLVQQARNEGWNLKQLEREVKDRLPSKYAGRAQNIARTETGKLETSVTLSTYREIGVEYYVWMSAMDERTRPEHAMMNGLICSVNDPTVWYEENPDDPMHPIMHKRDDTMVKLHPGEDFQCRCVMVAWDPMIDGKYEVKERPEEEEPEQNPENEPESRELEKANERLAEKEKELEKAENERKTVENELAQEKVARKAAEKAAAEQKAENESLKAKTAEAEQRAAQSEKRAESAEKTAKEEERRKSILQMANERHSRRSASQREEIQMRWDVRKALPATAWKFAKEVGTQEITGVNYKEEIEKNLKNRSKEYRVASRLVRTKFQRTFQEGKYAKHLPKENKVIIGTACAFVNPRGSGTSLLHEEGHALDLAIGKALGFWRPISVEKNFGAKVIKELTETLFQEADNFIAAHPEFEKGLGINRKRERYFRLKFIEAEYKDNPVKGIPTRFIKTLDGDDHLLSAFSDIINGVSNGEIDLGYYHKKGYWNLESVGKETFTHIGTISERAEGISLLESYIPENYKRWNAFIRLGADAVTNRPRSR